MEVKIIVNREVLQGFVLELFEKMCILTIRFYVPRVRYLSVHFFPRLCRFTFCPPYIFILSIGPTKMVRKKIVCGTNLVC